MRAVLEILADIPAEDAKALVASGVLRRNAIRELQAIANYKNLLAQGRKAVDACEEASSRYGMSQRTLWRVIKIYER